MMPAGLVGVVVGAVSGGLAGLVVSGLDVLRKDLRDARLRQSGIPLPSDRVRPVHHWVLAGVGAAIGGVLTAGWGVAPLRAALPIWLVPASCLAVVAVTGVTGALASARRAALPPPDPARLSGRTVREAEQALAAAGWACAVVSDRPDGPPQPRPSRRPGAPPTAVLGVRADRVLWVEFER